MEDLTQIEAGTTTQFIKDLNDNFGKIKNQFDAVNSFIFAEGKHKQPANGVSGSDVTWFYRLHTNGTAECWCTHAMVLNENNWKSWKSSNTTISSTGLVYNTGHFNPEGLSQLYYPLDLEIRNLDNSLKEDIEITSKLDPLGRLTRLFANSVKPKCFVTINNYTGAAMMFTTNRPLDEDDVQIYYCSPEVQAIYFSELAENRTIAVNCYVIGRWK